MTGEGTSNGNGYEHAGGYESGLSLSLRDLSRAMWIAVPTGVVSATYTTLTGQSRHVFGLCLGVALLIFWVWTRIRPTRVMAARMAERPDAARIADAITLIVIVGLIAYSVWNLRDLGVAP